VQEKLAQLYSSSANGAGDFPLGVIDLLWCTVAFVGEVLEVVDAFAGSNVQGLEAGTGGVGHLDASLDELALVFVAVLAS